MPMRVSSSSTSGRHPQSISYPSSPQASHHEPSSSGVAHGHGHGPSNYAEHPDRSAAAYAPGSGSDVLPERRHGGMHYQSASEPYQSGHWSDGSGVGGYESGAREVGHHGRYASAQGSGGSTGAFDSGARPLSPLSVAPASTASGPSGPSAPSAAAHWRDSHQRTIRQSVSEPDLASLESNRRQHYRRATEHQDEGPEDREDDLEEDELEEDELEEDERRMLAEMDDQEQEDERGRRPSKNASRPRNATSSSNVASRMYNQSQADPSTRLRYHAEHDQGAMFDGRGPPPSTQSYPHGSGSRDATYASGHGGHPYQYGGPHSRPNAFFQHSPYPPHHGQPQQPTIPHYHRSQQGPLPGVNPGHDQAPNGVDKNGSAASSSTSATTTAGTAAGTTARRGPYLSRQRALLVGLENTSPSSRYQCSYCLKRFSRPSSLRIHTYSHTGERPFRCSEEGCGRQFSVQSNMRRHLRVHRLGRLRSEFSGSSSTSTGPVTTTSASAATLAPAPATAGAV
ncbi:hypothetical protein BGW38_004224 [Lunasporangiospora selenospora]|uniref:C2H2-type domain-containing protein n=1 Tax=Lunasporangiospora selenospora TaxID=979761 RepID=A0A9P6FPL0_9FUNG|nr:hypothetical protein BGW38_004224 [Lunasporangiospora selenospora]